MNHLFTVLYGVVRQLPVRRVQTHGGAQTSDSLPMAISKPRRGQSLQTRLFLKATSGDEPPVQSMTDNGALILYDGNETSWVRAEPGSFVSWGDER